MAKPGKFTGTAGQRIQGKYDAVALVLQGGGALGAYLLCPLFILSIFVLSFCALLLHCPRVPLRSLRTARPVR